MIEAILPMVLLGFVSGLRKTLDGRSAEQETVSMTLKMRKTFPKSSGLFRPKIGGDNNTLGCIYNKVTQAIFFHIFYQCCKKYLKLSENLRNILGESSSRILANRAFHLNSD